jgi:MULE transposase domain
VLMVHDVSTDCYVPVFYILATGKTETTYWNALHCVRAATDCMLDPATVTCDFERALHNAVGDQFPSCNLVGCFIHLKQALRRKMIKLGISSAEIAVAMERDCVDLLTVIPHEDIMPKGVPHVNALIQARCESVLDDDSETVEYSTDKWTAFWAYFEKTWVTKYKPKTWNVHGIDATIVNRTNNPLERFNRELNKIFPTAHPSIPTFVATIEKPRGYVKLIEDVASKRAKPPKHAQPYVPRSVSL